MQVIVPPNGASSTYTYTRRLRMLSQELFLTALAYALAAVTAAHRPLSCAVAVLCVGAYSSVFAVMAVRFIWPQAFPRSTRQRMAILIVFQAVFTGLAAALVAVAPYLTMA